MSDRPISYSEISTWGRCRKQWGYGYRDGLQPIGLLDAPTLGTYGHIALAAHFSRTSWREAVRMRYEADKEKALRNPLFAAASLETLENVVDILLDIFPRYLDLWKDEIWEPIAVELPFQIDTERGSIHGTIDAIIKTADRNLYVVDHKFSSSFLRGEDLILNPQIGIYHWSARQLGYEIAGVIFNQIKPRKETLPKLLTTIDPKTKRPKGVSRSRVFCSWETYREFLIDNGYNVKDYLDMQAKLSTVELVDRQTIYRSPYEIEKFMEDVWERIAEINDDNHRIYRNENPMLCRVCAFRELCIEEVKGGDIEQIKKLNFTQRPRGTDLVEKEELPKEEEE